MEHNTKNQNGKWSKKNQKEDIKKTFKQEDYPKKLENDQKNLPDMTSRFT